MGFHRVFCDSSLGKCEVAQTHCKLGIGVKYMNVTVSATFKRCAFFNLD